MARHGGRGDESALGETFQLLAINCGALFLLAAPMLTCGAGAVECAVQIGGYYFAVVVDLAIESGALSPGNARISDENVQTTVEFLDDLVDGLLYWLPAGNIDLVRLA